jgi:hypothetical protein
MMRRYVGHAVVPILAILLAASAWAQEAPPAPKLKPVPRTATGLALPTTPIEADLVLGAERVNAWTVGTRRRLLLDKDVRFEIGAYRFRAARAYVEIEPFRKGGVVGHRIWAYLDRARSGAGGPIGQEAPRLLVTATLVGKIQLQTALLKRAEADNIAFAVAALARMGRHRDAVARATIQLAPGQPKPLAQRPKPPKAKRVPASVNFYAGRISYHTNKEKTEGYVEMAGEIQILYADASTNRRMSLRAERAVLFTDPGKAEGGSVAATAVRGMYLEGNVLLDDGKYIMRGPKIFYDLQTDRAVILKAVFFTWDETHRIPLYVRAKEIRQHSQTQWTMSGADLTTSEFREPHFSIGIDQLMITAEPRADEAAQHYIEAEGVRMKVGGVTVMQFPRMAGTATDIPLRRFKIGSSSRRGTTVNTQWHLFALLNRPKPDGVDARLLIDGYGKRGPGMGVDIRYDQEGNARNEFYAYYLHDGGVDEPGGRLPIEPQSEHRGFVHWKHQRYLLDDWKVMAEFSWLSDPNYLEEYHGSDAELGEAPETLLYLARVRGDSAFTFLAKDDLHNFVPTTDLLQTRGNIAAPGDVTAGYTTDKLPEIAWFDVGRAFWDNRLTYYGQSRVSSMRLNLPDDRPADRGFTAAESVALFGIASPTTGFDQGLRGNGLDEQTLYRFDTRHEIQAPMHSGVWSLTPYVTGRFTAYGDDFVEYGGDDDSERLWGAVGVKAHASFSKIDNTAESQLFDVHRLRHVIEPHAHVFHAGTNLRQASLPVYDYDVESVAAGTLGRIGLRNTWQTQRGGPGRWRSVDLLRLETDLVFASDDTPVESPMAKFIDYLPEQSLFGDHVWAEAAWQVTDSTNFVANANYGLESKRLERWTVGASFDHTPRFTTFAAVRDIEAVDSSLIRYGFDYLMTPKYNVGISQSYDLTRSRTRNFTLTLTRRLPKWLMVMVADVDSIEGVSSIGVAFVPEGLTGRGKPGNNPFMFR